MKRISRGYAAALLLLLGAFGANAAPPIVTLTLSASQPQYTVGEQIEITVELSNISATESVTVSAYDTGNLRVRVKKNGKRVRPIAGFALHDEDPRELALAALTTLAPGESVTLPFDVALDSEFGSIIVDQRLAKFKPKSKKVNDRSRTHPLEGTGQFELQLTYKYRGADGVFSDVLHRRLKSNTLSFSIVAAP